MASNHGGALEALIENAPEIIFEAARSGLGIVALVILVLAVLAVVFFWKDPSLIKLKVFVGLIVVFVGLALVAVYKKALEEAGAEVILASEPQEKNVQSGPLFDIETGKLGFPVDDELNIKAIQYECLERNEIDALSVYKVPVVYEQRENNWRARTNELLQNYPISLFIKVPQTIKASITGYSGVEIVKLHILTDDLYTHTLSAAELASGQLTINIGSPGFTNFLNQEAPKEPQLVRGRRRNLVEAGLGPIALLVVSAHATGGETRRSLPIGVVRSGFRFPDDTWFANDKPYLVFVNDSLPPLIVFQSRRECSPRNQGIFASTIDGSELWEISPKNGTHALRGVDSGPPGKVYYTSTYKTPSSMVCYMGLLDRKPIKDPIRVEMSLCQ